MNPLNRGQLKPTVVFLFILLFPAYGVAQLNATPSQEEGFMLNKAKTKIQEGQLDEGVRTLELFLVNYPESPITPDVLMTLGGALLQQGDLKKATESFQLFFKKFPQESRIHEVRYQLSQAYIQKGDLSKALSLWKGISGQQALKSLVYSKAAEIYIEREEFLQALRTLILKREVLVDPLEAESIVIAIRNIVETRLLEKDLQIVVSEFTPNFPADEALIKLIKLYDKKEAHYLEEKEIKRFLAVFPDHPYSTEVQKWGEAIRTKIKVNQYLIAALLPLSGGLSSFGTSALQGMQLALFQLKEILPGAPLSLVVKDSQSESGRNPMELEEWLNDYKPLAIIGPLLSKEVKRFAPIAEKGGWALITPGASAAALPSMGKTVFRNATTPRAQCNAIAEYAVLRLNLKRFAILFPNEHAGQEAVTCLSKRVTLLGGTIVLSRPYLPKETDFKDPILQLKANYRKKPLKEGTEGNKGEEEEEVKEDERRFDAIFLPGEASAIGLIIPQLVFHGMKNLTLLGTMGWNSPELLKLVGPYAEGAVFVDGFFLGSPDPLVQNFIKAYRKQFQQDPDLFAAQAYDTMRLLLETIKEGALTRSDVKTAIAQTRDFPGVSGYIYEMENGEAIKSPYFIQIKKGVFVQANE